MTTSHPLGMVLYHIHLARMLNIKKFCGKETTDVDELCYRDILHLVHVYQVRTLGLLFMGCWSTQRGVHAKRTFRWSLFMLCFNSTSDPTQHTRCFSSIHVDMGTYILTTACIRLDLIWLAVPVWVVLPPGAAPGATPPITWDLWHNYRYAFLP